MISRDNLRHVLLAIGFEKSNVGEFYTHDFGSCTMGVDFGNEKLIYPESKGLVVNDKTTSNFSHNENFVVFECVCRLLAKGYRPEHIELEPKWQLGRDQKGGKADILIKDENGDTLIIIECKTAGSEYNKEIKTQKNMVASFSAIGSKILQPVGLPYTLQTGRMPKWLSNLQ